MELPGTAETILDSGYFLGVLDAINPEVKDDLCINFALALQNCQTQTKEINTSPGSSGIKIQMLGALQGVRGKGQAFSVLTPLS